MTDSGAELMRHALGVQQYGSRWWKAPYRNHFVAGGDHVAIWDGLVARGFATLDRTSEIIGGDPVYFVTKAGREHALAGITFKIRWGKGDPTNA